MVYGVCRLILRDPVEAEDAAQQTFLSAYRALLRGTTPREPDAWRGSCPESSPRYAERNVCCAASSASTGSRRMSRQTP